MEEQESHGQHYTNVESVHTFYSSLHSIVQFQVLPQLNMTTKKSEWKISIHEKNRFSFLDRNGLFVICKYCERFGNSINKHVGRINIRRPFIGANTDKWSDHASTSIHRSSVEELSKMVDKGIDSEKLKRKADTQITSYFNKIKKLTHLQKSNQ